MTKAEKIRTMDDVELTEFLNQWAESHHSWQKDPGETLDVAPVRHGRWIPSDMGGGSPDEAYVCSACGEPFVLIDGLTPAENNFNWCPNCGAKMDGEDIGEC